MRGPLQQLEGRYLWAPLTWPDSDLHRLRDGSYDRDHIPATGQPVIIAVSRLEKPSRLPSPGRDWEVVNESKRWRSLRVLEVRSGVQMQCVSESS